MSLLRSRPWLLFAALYFALSAPFVGHYPLPSGDEVIGNDPAAEWVLHGRIQSTLFGELPGFERGYFLQPPGQVLSAAAAYTLLGVSIVSTRLHALAWAAVALAAWGALTAAWTGSRRAGLLTALFIACIPPLGHAIAGARMDAQALALVAFALLLWLPAPGLASRRPVAAGFLIGCAGLTHPIIIFWALGLGAGALVAAPERRRQLPYLVGGALVPFAGWMLSAALLPDEFRHQFLGHGAGKLGGFDILGLISGEAHRTLLSFSQQPLLPFLYVAGAVAWWRAFRAEPAFRRETSIFAAVVILGVTFGLEKSSGPHLLYHSALLSVAAAALIASLLDRAATPSPWPRRLALATVSVVVSIGAVRWALPRLVALGPQRTARDHAAFARDIAQLIPPGSNVAGEPVAYYAVRAAGGWLRLGVAPDPRRHHFVISDARSPWQLGPDFETVAVVGHPLKPWLGRTFSPSEELHVVVARSRLFAPPAR